MVLLPLGAGGLDLRLLLERERQVKDMIFFGIILFGMIVCAVVQKVKEDRELAKRKEESAKKSKLIAEQVNTNGDGI